MNPLQTLLQYGSSYWTEGHNGTILAVDSYKLCAAGIEPESLCSLFSDVPRIALKILKQSTPGAAAAEREKHMAAYDLLDGVEATTNVRIPAILSETTSGHLDAPELLTCLAGLAPHGGNVEYLLMEWVEGTDFATLAYRAALHSGLQHSLEEYGETEHMHAARSILNVFLNAKILMSAARLRPGAPQNEQAQRIGGRLRAVIREGGDLLRLWESLLLAAKAVALEQLQIGEIIDALTRLREGDLDKTNRLIESQLDADALEEAVAVSNSYLMNYYLRDNTERGRSRAFCEMLRDLVRDRLILPASMRTNLEAAVRFLNQRDYYHNDLHERNIMISHDLKDPYIIDMASATLEGGTDGADLGVLAPGGLFHAAASGS